MCCNINGSKVQLLLIPGNPPIGQVPHQYAICMLMCMQVSAVQLLEHASIKIVHLTSKGPIANILAVDTEYH